MSWIWHADVFNFMVYLTFYRDEYIILKSKEIGQITHLNMVLFFRVHKCI